MHAAPQLAHRLLQRAIRPHRREHILVQPNEQLLHGHALHLRHGTTAYGKGQGLRAQPTATAGGAHAVLPIIGQKDAHGHLVRVLLHVIKNTFITVPQPRIIGGPHIHPLRCLAVQHPVALLLRQLPPGYIRAHGAALVVAPHQILVAGRERPAAEHLERAVLDAQLRHQPALVVIGYHAAVTLAHGAGPQGRVAAEESRHRFRQRIPITAVAASCAPLIPRTQSNLCCILTQLKGRLQCLLQSRAGLRFQPHAILHHAQVGLLALHGVRVLLQIL